MHDEQHDSPLSFCSFFLNPYPANIQDSSSSQAVQTHAENGDIVCPVLSLAMQKIPVESTLHQ